jgi:alpha-L-fucosidase
MAEAPGKADKSGAPKNDQQAQTKPAQGKAKSLEQLQEEYLDLQFGMFLCLGIATYHEKEWAKGTEPASSFNPTKLDCDQWAKAAKSAGMRYGMFTTKHVGGFALWDTAESDYDVASSPYGKDVVRQYVDAFRKQDMEIGLYFSIWDGHHNISKGNVTPEKVAHVKAQLRELLTNYGKVDMLWLDGYQHEKRGRTFFPTTREVPFNEIYALVKELQPNCLVMRHPGMAMYDTEYTDVQIWEGIFTHVPTRKCWERYQREHPEGVQEVCDTLQRGWYWKKAMPKQPLLSAANVVDKLEICQKHNSNYLLNAAVNREGLLDENVVERLQAIGEAVREAGILKQDGKAKHKAD